MKTLIYKVIIGLGLGMAIVYAIAIGVLLTFDNTVFDLPNHKLIISGGGFHLYEFKGNTIETDSGVFE